MDSFYTYFNDNVGCRYKGSMEENEQEKREDEATDGDGVVTIKPHEKN